MLKTCFRSTNYTNFINKTCGEIVCQTETSFTIVCSLCAIKIFDYEEFIKHFRDIHWPEILEAKECSGSVVKWSGDSIKTESENVNVVNQDESREQQVLIEELHYELNEEEHEEQQQEKDELEDNAANSEMDSEQEHSEEEGETNPLAILKKVNKALLNKYYEFRAHPFLNFTFSL